MTTNKEKNRFRTIKITNHPKIKELKENREK